MVSQGTAERILKRLRPAKRADVTEALAYDEEQVGRYIASETYTVGEDVTAGELLRELKSQDLPAYTDAVLVTDVANGYLGQVDINLLLSSDRSVRVGDIAHSRDDVLTATMPLLQPSRVPLLFCVDQQPTLTFRY